MKEELFIELLRFATKFGILAAIEIAKAAKAGATIDDAIAAMERANAKTAADYLAEAKAAIK